MGTREPTWLQFFDSDSFGFIERLQTVLALSQSGGVCGPQTKKIWTQRPPRPLTED